MDDLLSKYQVTSLKDFVGNRSTILSLKKQFAEDGPIRGIVVGPPGCGKTLLCNLLLKEHSNKFDVLNVKCNAVDDIKAITQLVENFVARRTIESFFSKKRKLVFFDDVDAMMYTDRGLSAFLATFVCDAVKENNDVSVLMTCSLSEEKKIADLKKRVPVVRLANPSAKETLAYVVNILEKEQIDYAPTKLVELVDTYRNIRNVCTNLHQLSLNKEAIAKEKDMRFLFDSTNFDITKKILTRNLSMDSIRLVGDNYVVPLLVYENYQREIFHNRLKQPLPWYYTNIATVMDSTMDAEVIEKHMFTSMDWSTYDCIVILKCGYLNNIVNSIPRKKVCKDLSYNFTQSLTKAATRQSYGKRLKCLQDNLGIHDTKAIYKVFDTSTHFSNSKQPLLATYLEHIRGQQSSKRTGVGARSKRTEKNPM